MRTARRLVLSLPKLFSSLVDKMKLDLDELWSTSLVSEARGNQPLGTFKAENEDIVKMMQLRIIRCQHSIES